MKLFVTGGSRGIGKGTVLLAAEKGYDVAFTYVKNKQSAIDVLEEAKRISPKNNFFCYQLDIKDSNSVEEVYEQTIQDLGNIDAVVCNAGVNKDGLVFSMSDEDWNEVISTNLTGNFYIARQFLQEFIANKHGRFVFVSSIIRNGGTGQANYAASKSGLVGLSGTIAKEYGSKGISSNVVVPSCVETDMVAQSMSPQLKKFWLDYCPLHRLCSMEEMCELILFMSAKNNGFVNGQVIQSSGGLDWSY